MDFDVKEYLIHYGTPRHSGRYPWGSGNEGDLGNQRHRDFLSYVKELEDKGLSQVQVAEGLGIKTTELRAKKAIAKNELRKDLQNQAVRLSEKGMSNVAIGERLGLGESRVRALIDPANREKNDILQTTASMLRDQVKEKTYLDVGKGAELGTVGVSETKMKQAVAILREEGYDLSYHKILQPGTGKYTTVKVLSPEGTKHESYKNEDKIQQITSGSQDGGKTFDRVKPPIQLNGSRVEVKYGPDGGADKDGIIELRRGVDDLSMGKSRYAQVRIAVDGKSYLKGMAIYADDLPDGVDVRFNTNKKDTGDKHDAMKPLKDDPNNPFGAVIKADGQKGVLNIVNEEGDWDKWSKNLSSQVLSKQSPVLAKRQLDLKYKTKLDEFEEIQSLTNPTVKKKLLGSFADGVDASSEHLKAAALPRQRTQVILPINSMKPDEIYAPNFKDGEKVVLIRYPHGGIFEIPELTVNNKGAEAKRVMDRAKDAVGIHTSVAGRLSGADFDGDTVLVIPNNKRSIKNKNELEGLKGFEPKTAYAKYDGMKVLDSRGTQREMGIVSNLITDMTIKGASDAELARAIRHSMVVIDAAKHELDYKRSEKENGIALLKAKYQEGGGASTLISRATSSKRVPERKDNYTIDPATGKKIYKLTGDSYPAQQKNGSVKTVERQTKSIQIRETDDAHTLSSGQPIESVYADHSNKLKALGNQARKELLNTPNLKRSPSSATAYAPQVKTLKAKLNVALKNAPLERQAILVANTMINAKRQADPEMDAATLKKIKGLALTEARARTGALKQRIEITPDEWAAIQAGAVSNNLLNQVLNNTDLDKVKALATPRATVLMTPTKISRAKAMYASGFNQAEIADQLGVSVSSIHDALE